jgi:predicted RNA polymerase sigma factor
VIGRVVAGLTSRAEETGERIAPAPVVALDRAVAVAMAADAYGRRR